MQLRTDDKQYTEYLQSKFLPGRQFYLEQLVYPRYLRELSSETEILDFGFGNGEFLTFCQKNGIVARGIDSNPHFIESARLRNLNVELDDITRLDTLPNGNVKAVISDNVLEHLSKDALFKVFRALELKLAKNGVFLAIVPGEKGFTKDPTHQTFIDEYLISSVTANSSIKLEKTFRWPFDIKLVSKVFYLNMTAFKFRKK